MTLKLLADYGKAFQLKVLGALLTDKKFLQTVADILKEDYWDSSAHKWIIKEILDYYAMYHTNVTMEVLKIELQKIDNEVLKLAIKEELKHSYAASQDDLEYVIKEFTSFSRNQEMKNAILASTERLKCGDFEGIRSLVENALKAGVEKSVGHEYKKDIETRYRDDYRPTIPTPWEPVNKVYSGGLGPGDLFLVFGGPGAGKSWISIACAAHAVQLGYNVVYYSLELGESYVARRFDSYFTGYTVDECKARRGEVEDILKNLPGNLVIKEYPPKSASFSTLEAHLQKLKDEGMNVDMVVIDYLDYMRPTSKRYSERKDEVDDAYLGGKGLAKRLGIPVISPSQVNRSGARDQIVEGDKAAGSYDKMMVADGAISFSRTKEDKAAGTGRVHIMKSRFGGDGITYDVTFNASNGRMEFQGEYTTEEAKTTSGIYKLDKDLISSFFDKK